MLDFIKGFAKFILFFILSLVASGLLLCGIIVALVAPPLGIIIIVIALLILYTMIR